MKTLHLLRHAKSDWSDGTRPDRDRPLNRRGKQARHIVAEHVEGWPVDLVLCSTARRARDTAKTVIATLRCPVEYCDGLYGADVADVLDLVSAVPDAHRAVMVVGHNPTMEDVTAALCGQSPAYPTAALGTVRLDVEHWVETAPGAGTLEAFFTVREPRERD
jgi:phosphohistidine phosphatase